MGNEKYLGDGVYASFDGYQIWLRTTREDGIDHMIALEPEVLRALKEYVNRLNEAARVLNAGASNGAAQQR